MSLFIRTNSSAQQASRQLTSSTNALSRSFERLSSGLRINSAKDDAAGLSISTRLTTQINGLNQAVRNSNDGVSLAQTAEGALSEVTNNLQRIRELAVQSANSTNNASDRASLQAEAKQLTDEIERITSTTTFNGNKLLDGTFLSRKLQIGANVDQALAVSVHSMTSDALARQARYESETYASSDSISALNGLTISNASGSFAIRSTVIADDTLSTTLRDASAIAKAKAINDLSAESGVRAIVGETVLTSSTLSPGVGYHELTHDEWISINGEKLSGFTVLEGDADGSLVDAINAISSTTGVVASMTSDARLTLTASDGRNINLEFSSFISSDFGFDATAPVAFNPSDEQYIATAKLSLQSEKYFELSGDVSLIGFNNTGVYGVHSDYSVQTIDISSVEGATLALDIVDLAIDQVSFQRAGFGALQNRLESTISNLTTTSENLSASRSRILDADFAAETAQLSRNQILQQAGVSILAQANQQPQIALSLL